MPDRDGPSGMDAELRRTVGNASLQAPVSLV